LLYVKREPGAEIVSLRSFIQDDGARLKQLLSQIGAQAAGPLRIPKVHPDEISKEFLATLGFRADGGYRLYAAKAGSDEPMTPRYDASPSCSSERAQRASRGGGPAGPRPR